MLVNTHYHLWITEKNAYLTSNNIATIPHYPLPERYRSREEASEARDKLNSQQDSAIANIEIRQCNGDCT